MQEEGARIDPTPCSISDKLDERLRQETGMDIGLCQALMERVDPRLVRDGLEKLPAWKEYNQVRPPQYQVRSWAGWFYSCLVRGPLAGVQKTAADYWKHLKGSPDSSSSPGIATAFKSKSTSSRPVRQGKPSSWSPTPDVGRKVAAGQAQAELAEQEEQARRQQAELEGRFDALQQLLTEDEMKQAFERARTEAGPWVPEDSHAFQGLLRATTVDQFGDRLQTGPDKAGGSGLPWKLGRRSPAWSRKDQASDTTGTLRHAADGGIA